MTCVATLRVEYGDQILGFCISKADKEICGIDFTKGLKKLTSLKGGLDCSMAQICVAFNGDDGFVRPCQGVKGSDGLGLKDGGEGMGGSEMVKGEAILFLWNFSEDSFPLNLDILLEGAIGGSTRLAYGTILDQRVKNLESTSHQGNEEGTLFQNPSDDEDEIVNLTTDMVQEEQPSQKFLETISRINFQKWHSKAKIVISKDFKFEVIALIDSGANLNCIQEGIIPSKYFRKTRERLTSTSGVKNMTNRVILGNPFMCLLYPFITDSERITTHPFGQLAKFKFLRSLEPRDISSLQEVSVSKILNLISAKTKHLEYLKDDLRYKMVEEQLTCKNIQEEIKKFEERLKQEVCSDLPTAFWHRKRHKVALPYVKDFNEKDIPTKARPIQMNQELMVFCRARPIQMNQSSIYQNLRKQCKPPFDRLQTNPSPWTQAHTSVIQEIKKYVKTLPCLGIPSAIPSRLSRLMPLT
ncbi:hypothetical protein SO802_033924 [Lithocarpus litseifolius]|uniref:Peptidase A2 domain-containing protein n=1 Tax=Lithocarpus litseifolius TaxID=425828 RepID=A0AAW2BEG3_9ROSI